MWTTWLGGVGGLVLVAGLAVYVGRVARGDLRPPPLVTRGAVLLGAALAVGGLAGAGSLTAAIPSVLTLLGASAAVTLHALRRVPLGTLQVDVGDPMLPFGALTPAGEVWDSGALRGRRVLLKFFRGQWCPFCSAELQRFDAMRDALAEHAVEVVAISKDPPADARRHLARDGLRLTLLCDPDLRAIRRYGVEHRRALEISRGLRVSLLGLEVGTIPRFVPMAAPTTLLIDELGVVRWVDQTDDYKVRSSAERVLAKIVEVFGEALISPAT